MIGELAGGRGGEGVKVLPAKVDTAPSFVGQSKRWNTNTLYFVTGVLEERFCGTLLDALFFDPQRGFLRQPSLPSPVTREDVLAFDTEIDRHRTIHPTAVPRFVDEEGEYADQSETSLAWLLRLRFWLDWAVTHCDTPTIMFT